MFFSVLEKEGVVCERMRTRTEKADKRLGGQTKWLKKTSVGKSV